MRVLPVLPASPFTQTACALTQRTRRGTQRAQAPLRTLRQGLCGLCVESGGGIKNHQEQDEGIRLRILQARGVAT